MARNMIPELENDVAKLMRLYWPEDVLLAVARELRRRGDGHYTDAAEAAYGPDRNAPGIGDTVRVCKGFAEAYYKAGALVVAAASELDDGE